MMWSLTTETYKERWFANHDRFLHAIKRILPVVVVVDVDTVDVVVDVDTVDVVVIITNRYDVKTKYQQQ